jgi:heme-degrading monooxygenase HmoA
MNKAKAYKVILIFNLKVDQADEELKRSSEADSFPNMLAQQPGFTELELVRVDANKTMSIQTWETERDWWNALEAVKQLQSEMPKKQQRESILESRDFIGGQVARHIQPTKK